jgi:hypothetical protein
MRKPAPARLTDALRCPSKGRRRAIGLRAQQRHDVVTLCRIRTVGTIQ